MVPKDVSATGEIGHTHSVSLDGDTLTVKVNYNEKGESKTTILSVTDLYRQSNNGKTKLDFKYGDLGHKYLIKNKNTRKNSCKKQLLHNSKNKFIIYIYIIGSYMSKKIYIYIPL